MWYLPNNNNTLNTESQMGCPPEKQTTDHIFTLHLINKHGQSTKTEEDICLYTRGELLIQSGSHSLTIQNGIGKGEK